MSDNSSQSPWKWPVFLPADVNLTTPTIHDYSSKIIREMERNREHFIGVFLAQNPSANLADYALCHQTCHIQGGEFYLKTWLEKKS